jgi:hypothetical protein
MNGKNDLKFDIISDPEKAKDIWRKLSPDRSIYDNWDFRYCFYKYFNFPLHFIVGKIDNGEIGLLPLQFNDEKMFLEFFGGNFMEDNHVFIKKGYEECVSGFYENISERSRLEDICDSSPFESSLEILEYKYVADLKGMNSIDEYLVKYFRSKRRNAINKKISFIESLKPIIAENNHEDLDLLIELNKKRFGKQSSFNKPFRHEIYHDLLDLGLDIKMLTFIVNGTKEAVTLGIRYRNVFVGINGGTREEAHQDLGTYITVKKIENAIGLGVEKYDAGLEDLGWKENWHFEKIPQRIFIKK